MNEPNLTMFDNAKSVVTHPGQAHRDETMAVMFLLAANPNLVVYRRDPSAEDLADPAVIVVDVGRQHDPSRNNFDHHQFPRDAQPACALTLVLAHMGLLKQARRAFPWLEFTEILDCRGPVVAAEWAGTNADKLMGTMSPIEASVLKIFERGTGDALGLTPGMAAHDLLLRMGVEKTAFLRRFARRIAYLDVGAAVVTVAAGANRYLEVIDASFIPADDDPTLALEAWVKDNYPAAAVTITKDDRGDGTSVFRRNDHPRIDFSVLDGKPGTVFAHKNGFVAKLAAGVDPVAAVRQSVKAEQ